jgi:hypothetical protein
MHIRYLIRQYSIHVNHPPSLLTKLHINFNRIICLKIQRNKQCVIDKNIVRLSITLREYHESHQHIAQRSACYSEENVTNMAIINALSFIVLIMDFKLEFINLLRNVVAYSEYNISVHIYIAHVFSLYETNSSLHTIACHQLCPWIQPTESICVFHIFLVISSDFFPIHH